MKKHGEIVIPPDDFAASLNADDRHVFSNLFLKRARSELHIAAAFSAISHEAILQSLPLPIVRLAVAAPGEELAHATAWHTLANQYEPVGELTIPQAMFVPSYSDEPLTRLILRSVSLSCLNETVANARLQTMLWRIRGEAARAVVHEILADEVRHARVGWAILGFIAQKRPSILQLVSAMMPRLLTSSMEVLFNDLLETPEFVPESRRFHTILGRHDTAVVIAAAIRDLVVPGLAHVNVDPTPTAHWLAEFRRVF